MDINAILDWIEQMIEKYQIAEDDVAVLDEIVNGISEEDLYGGDEYQEEVPDEE